MNNCHLYAGAHRGQRSRLDTLETVASHQMRVLGIELFTAEPSLQTLCILI